MSSRFHFVSHAHYYIVFLLCVHSVKMEIKWLQCQKKLRLFSLPPFFWGGEGGVVVVVVGNSILGCQSNVHPSNQRSSIYRFYSTKFYFSTTEFHYYIPKLELMQFWTNLTVSFDHLTGVRHTCWCQTEYDTKTVDIRVWLKLNLVMTKRTYLMFLSRVCITDRT